MEGGGKGRQRRRDEFRGEQNDTLIVSLLFHPTCRDEEERTNYSLINNSEISKPIIT